MGITTPKFEMPLWTTSKVLGLTSTTAWTVDEIAAPSHMPVTPKPAVNASAVWTGSPKPQATAAMMTAPSRCRPAPRSTPDSTVLTPSPSAASPPPSHALPCHKDGSRSGGAGHRCQYITRRPEIHIHYPPMAVSMKSEGSNASQVAGPSIGTGAYL